MKCSKCGQDSRVYKTDSFATCVIRLRACTNTDCDWSIKTYEQITEKEREIPKDKETNAGKHIYVICCPLNGLIKIGFSKMPTQRLKNLQNMSPVPLVLVKLLTGTQSDEAAIHKRFNKYKHHSEWFFPTDEILQFIESEGSESIDIDLMKVYK